MIYHIKAISVEILNGNLKHGNFLVEKNRFEIFDFWSFVELVTSACRLCFFSNKFLETGFSFEYVLFSS